VLKILVMADATEVLTIKEVARRGGVARARNLSAERRKEIACRAAQARWGKKANGSPDGAPPDGGGGSDDRRVLATLAGPTAGIMSTRRRPAERVAPSDSTSGRHLAAAA